MTQHDQQDQQDQHDPEILDAYRRMSTSLAAPGDPLPGVRRAIRRRRVVRRGLAGVVALAVVGAVGGGLALRGGSDDSDDLAAVDEPTATPTPTGPASTLTYQRADGTTYTFDVAGLALSCERVDGVQTLQLQTAEPAFDKKSDTLLEPLLSVEVLPGKVTPGQVFTLPFESESGSSEGRPMTFFVASPEGGKRANEISSAEQGAGGTVTVESASCEAAPQLTLSIEGTLGSEVNQPAMAISGSYTSG